VLRAVSKLNLKHLQGDTGGVSSGLCANTTADILRDNAEPFKGLPYFTFPRSLYNDLPKRSK